MQMHTWRRLAATIALGFAAQSHAQDKIELKVTTFVPPTHGFVVDVLEPWVKDLEKRTGGKVTGRVFAGNSPFGKTENQADQVKQIGNARPGLISSHLVEVGVQVQELRGGEPLVEAEMLGEEPDSFSCGWVTQRLAEQGCRARRGKDQAQQHFDRSGLARAVGPQKAKDLSLLDAQGKVFDGDVVAHLKRHFVADGEIHAVGTDITGVFNSTTEHSHQAIGLDFAVVRDAAIGAIFCETVITGQIIGVADI